MIKTVVVGCGNAGRDDHIPALERHPKTEIIAVADKDESQLEETIADLDGVKGYTDIEELFEETAPDSVHICTPPQTHLQIAKQVLTNGVPVLIEKPVAMHTGEVQELIEAAEDAETVVSVIHNQLFRPAVRRALQRVESGEIGEVVSVTMLHSEEFDLYDSPRGDWVFELPGGEVGEGIPHQVYLPLAFVDSLGEITAVSKHNYSEYEGEVTFDGVTLEARDSAKRRSITVKILTSSPDMSVLHIHGTDGVITVDLLKQAVFQDQATYTLTPETVPFEGFDIIRQYVTNVGEKIAVFMARKLMEVLNVEGKYYPQIAHREPVNGHYVQIDEFVTVLESGDNPPVTLEEAYETIRALEALSEPETAESSP